VIMSILSKPRVPIKKKIGKQIYTLYGSMKGTIDQNLFSLWDIRINLEKKGHSVKYSETEQRIGKRKPVYITSLWVS